MADFQIHVKTSGVYVSVLDNSPKTTKLRTFYDMFSGFYTYATWYGTNQTTPLENVPLKLESQIYKYHERCNVKVDNPSWEKEHHLQECRLVGDMLVLWEGSSREGFYLQLL